MGSILSVFDIFSAWQTTAEFMCVNIMLAASMQLGLRSGVFSVAPVAFFGLGAYASAILSKHYHVSFAVALLGGVVIATLSTVILLYPVHRLRGLYLAISTLAMVIVLQVVYQALTITGGTQGLFGIPIETQFWQLLLASVLTGLGLWLMEHSRTGRAFRAIGFDEPAAAAAGVQVGYYRTMAFVLSAALAGLAGGFFSHLLSFISNDQYGLSEVVLILSMVVLGGLNRWQGAFLGAILITALPQVLESLVQWKEVINGVILIVVIVYLPGGLAELPRGARRLVARWRPGSAGSAGAEAG